MDNDHQQQWSWDYDPFNDLNFEILTPPLETCFNEIANLGEILDELETVAEPNSNKQDDPGLLAPSLQLLNRYGNGLTRLINERFKGSGCDTLSTEEIVRIAGARFVQSCIPSAEEFSCVLRNSRLSDEDASSVELIELLLASAEKVGNHQFDCASRLLNQCDILCSKTGNPIQRIVYYFSEALRERTDRETGKKEAKGVFVINPDEIYEAMMSPSSTNVEYYQRIPFPQISHFAGIQVIIDTVGDAKKIHVIDLEIRAGQQWTILMQALVSRRGTHLECLKITAIATSSRDIIEQTGDRLRSFAQAMNISFDFNIVMVSDIVDSKEDLFGIKENLFGVEEDEMVAVFSEYYLPRLIAVPNQLDALIKVIGRINPSIMIVTEVEANHNSPIFVNRFIECLFFVSAYFDCIDTCMQRDDPNRVIGETLFFGEGIMKIVAAEGDKRTNRNVKIDVWRAYFARFRMEESELSMSALYQANLVRKKFACGSSCTLGINGKSLVIGWKGTPIHCLSAWKFK